MNQCIAENCAMNSSTAKPAVPPQKFVGVWIRVSTEDQAKGESPEHHIARAREYAKWNNWTIREIYDLAGVSGKTVKDHPEARRMMRDIERGHITGLIFSKLARLARNTKELLEFSDFFRQHDVDMISLQEKIDTSSPSGRLFYTMIAAMAQWEREEIADRVNASIKIRAKLGKNLGGAAPFGYLWKDNKIIPNPIEAPIRQRMYELFAESKRRKSVARQLNNEGYRTRNGSKFTDTTVVRLIQDPTAKGLYRANHTYRDGKGNILIKPESEWILTPVPAIISEELWQQCNDILAEHKAKRPPGPRPVHLFSGLLKCGCGASMYIYTRSPKYVCQKCRNKIPAEDLDNVMREELKEFFVSKERIQQHMRAADENIAVHRDRLTSHKTQLDRVRGEMKKVYQLFQADNVTPETFGNLYKPLEEQERALAAEYPILQGELDVLEMRLVNASEVAIEAADLYRLWPSLDVNAKRKVLESIVERITLTDNTIDIRLCYLPSSEELTKKQRNLWDSWPPPA
jgi:site-specific DNA recombinase